AQHAMVLVLFARPSHQHMGETQVQSSGSFLVTSGHPSRARTDAEYDDGYCRLSLRDANPHHIQWTRNDNGFSLFVGERGPSGTLISGRAGSVVNYTSGSRRVTVSSDTLGTVSIFYCTDGTEARASNRL